MYGFWGTGLLAKSLIECQVKGLVGRQVVKQIVERKVNSLIDGKARVSNPNSNL